VVDPTRLVVGLTGLQKQDGNSFLTWFRQLTLKILKDRIAELCVKQKWPLPDVTSGAYTEEIEADAIGGIRKEVESYGLEVVRFGDFTIAMGEEDEGRLNKFYEKASYINMSGGMAGYQQFAQAEMMMNAGEGMAKGGGGGGALAGAGIGLGFGMAGQMMGAMNQQGQNQQAPAQPVNTPQSGMATNKVTCPSCNQSVNPGKFCSECGKTLEAVGPKFCSNCGKPMTGKFCGECGTAAP
jgi:membrane protease subunit (stomatin/prohibitin family)